jgi:KaiC/GvpD/RAD55 family RecA-like ATPase
LIPSRQLPEQHRAVALMLADGIEIDTSIYSRSRLFRLPNTVNGKSGFYKTALTVNEFRNLPIEDIKESAAKQCYAPHLDLIPSDTKLEPNEKLIEAIEASTKPVTSQKSNIQSLHMERERRVECLEGLHEGNRHNGFSRIIGRLIYDGHDSDFILQMLTPHAEKVGWGPELRSLINDMTARYDSSSKSELCNSDSNRNEFKALPLSQFLSVTDTTIDWQVEGLIADETATIFGGFPGCGKTFLLIDLALAVATGGMFMDHFPTQQGNVLFIDEENSPQLVASRFNAQIMGRNLEPPIERIEIAVGEGFMFENSTQLRNLERVLTEFQPNIVIIDSLIRVHGAEENSAREMAKTFRIIKRLIRRYNVSFVFSDHIRKQTSKILGAALRGSSDKWAFVDTLLAVSKSHDMIVVQHAKSRFAEEVKPVSLKLSGSTKDRIVITHMGEAELREADRRLSENSMIVLNIIGDDWKSRKEIVDAAEVYAIESGMVDKALSHLVLEKQIIKEKRKLDGPGAKADFYHRNPCMSDDEAGETIATKE